MKIVIIESPYAGDIKTNEAYARAAMLDSLRRGEAPFISHLLYTQVLDDLKEVERKIGMLAGWEFLRVADLQAVYIDLGISKGMAEGIEQARQLGLRSEERRLYCGEPLRDDDVSCNKLPNHNGGCGYML